jgi:hypothetical protein
MEERRSNNRRERAQGRNIYMDGKDGQDGGEKDGPQIDTDKHRSGMANENLAELCGPQGVSTWMDRMGSRNAKQ